MSRYQVLFAQWRNLVIGLDMWPSVRRIAKGCSSKAYPLYSTFMGKLAQYIFELDAQYLSKLKEAIVTKHKSTGIKSSNKQLVQCSLTKERLQHCR